MNDTKTIPTGKPRRFSPRSSSVMAAIFDGSRPDPLFNTHEINRDEHARSKWGITLPGRGKTARLIEGYVMVTTGDGTTMQMTTDEFERNYDHDPYHQLESRVAALEAIVARSMKGALRKKAVDEDAADE